MDADRKARMFVTDVRNTDTPVLFKHSAVWSLKNKRWRHWWPAQVSGQGMRPTYTSKWHVRTADLMRSGFFFFKRNVLCFLTRYREALRWNLCACWPNSLRRCAPLKRYRPLPDPAPRKEWSERRIDIPLCAFKMRYNRSTVYATGISCSWRKYKHVRNLIHYSSPCLHYFGWPKPPRHSAFILWLNCSPRQIKPSLSQCKPFGGDQIWWI